MTPLIAATKRGDSHIVRMILKHLPQSISLRDVADMSALAWAVAGLQNLAMRAWQTIVLISVKV